MSPSRLLSGCGLVAVACSVLAGAQAPGGAAVFFEGARLIAGDGTAQLENSAFLVQGDTIGWVGRRGERQPPAGATRIDLTGTTVMPSLIDGHNHIGLVNQRDGTNSKDNYTRDNLIDQLQRYAYYGVAAALSMGLEADQELAYTLRDELIPNAARFYTVGKGIAATRMGGPPGEARLGIPWGAATEAEGREHVRDLHARGVRFVKIWVDDRDGTVPKLQPNVYRAIIDEAHRNGQQVLAHLSRASALADAKNLLRAGVDGFVHTVRDRDVDDEYLALVKAHPKTWTGPNVPGPEVGNDLLELHCRNLRRIHDAGMVIGLGTDGVGDGAGPHEQMAFYTRCGMTAREAIMSATSINARLLFMDRLGTIAAGKEASFNVLDANPLDDITNTRRISRVYLRGQELDRAGLRARWTASSAPK